jgi:carbon monoxide dehydrogenase subunit G
MASVSAQIDVTATPEQAWAVLSDPATFSSWMDNHQGFVGEPPTALAPGGAFGQRLRVMGMPAEVRWTVDGLEQPRRLVLKGTGPMGIGLTASYVVTPGDAATRIETTFDFSGAAVFAVAGQLQREVGQTLQVSLGKLKALVES